ncbi:MAG: hypothetical protein LBG72_05530 [Spirochaetaceae bacterium]|nr:hypothetical protein [Spirochaetaceae bacterium]
MKIKKLFASGTALVLAFMAVFAGCKESDSNDTDSKDDDGSKTPTAKLVSLSGLSDYEGRNFIIMLSADQQGDDATAQSKGVVSNGAAGKLPLLDEKSQPWTGSGNYYAALGFYAAGETAGTPEKIFISKTAIAFTNEETVITFSKSGFDSPLESGKSVTVTGLDAYNGKYLMVSLIDPSAIDEAPEQMFAATTLPAIINDGQAVAMNLIGTGASPQEVADGNYMVCLSFFTSKPSQDEKFPNPDSSAISTKPVNFTTGTVTVQYSAATFIAFP